jgi:hypothetical protein
MSGARICIYAFSSTALFFRALIDECRAAGDAVEWSVIVPQGHFRHCFAGAIPAERRCYLYQRFGRHYAASGAAQIARGLATGEGLIAALMKDKDGYRRLDKDEQLRRAAAMQACYEEFLDRVRPDFVLFPDLETVDGFVLMNLCRAKGIGVLYLVGMRFLGRSFFSADPYETLPPYFGAHDAADLAAARAVLGRFRAQRNANPGDAYPPAPPPKPSLFRRTIISAWIHWRYERLHASEERLKWRITRNFLFIASRLRRAQFELAAARYFDRPDTVPANYVFYALHYTPESSINGLEPYYVDQLRAIDALLFGLPRGHRLVVKEHPAMYGMRPLAFYRTLRRRPGLVLLHPTVSSRTLIEGASLVATVTGTVALEAYLLGKPSIVFGRTFFAHLCRAAPALRELGPMLEAMIAAHRPASEAETESAIARLLAIGADFTIGDPWLSPTTMAAENIQAAREYLWRHLARLRLPDARPLAAPVARFGAGAC